MTDHSHHPCGVKDDALGYKAYAKAICEEIDDVRIDNTGLTIGVFGDWGIGKSSVLRMVNELLVGNHSAYWKPKRKFLIAEFNAWEYTKQEDLWLALIRRIMSSIESHPAVGTLRLVSANLELRRSRLQTNPSFWNSIFTLLRLLIVLLGIAIFVWGTVLVSWLNQPLWANLIWIAGGTTVFITVWTSAVGRAIVAALQNKIALELPPLTRSAFDTGRSLAIDDFRNDFHTVIGTIGRQMPVVVLIDDLDRCSFEQVVPVLEAIKHLGTFSSIGFGEQGVIIFILAVDRRAIEQAVAGYYRDYLAKMGTEDANRFVREYVEKIVQVPFDLPPLSRVQLDHLLEQM